MTGKEFKNRLLEMFQTPPGKKMMDSIHEDAKGEFPCLMTLYNSYEEGVDVTTGEISNKMCVSTARIAALINTLEHKELVSRYSDAKDKRKTFVKLTDKGLTYVKENISIIEKRMDKATQGISYEDFEIFFKVTKKMKENMEGGNNV